MSLVLVVDDEANIRKFAAVNLKARGYRVMEAESAETALAALKAGQLQPEVLLLDIKLPGMSGWEMLDVMSDDPQIGSIPVVVMTASSTQGVANRQRYGNVTDVLIKPLTVAALIAVVERALV